MPKFKATTFYGNSQFFVNAGDVIEIDADEAERLNRDSPGTFEPVDAAASSEAVELGVLTEHGAAVKAEIGAQIPTVDLDVEDKAKEIPGEGNKYTPASGYDPNPTPGVRVVERASNDRQMKGAATRADEVSVPAADTSASARVTDATPASLAADEKQLEGGVTAQSGDGEDAAAKKKAADEKAAKQADADAKAAANKGTMTSADVKATKKG